MDELRAVVYCRLSRSPETDENIEQQRVRGCAVVEERGWTLIRNGDSDAFVDDGRSAFKEDVHRPAWTALLAQCAAGEVDVIVARDSDRLSRNWDDYARLVRSGARVLTWAEGAGQPVDPDDTEGAIRAMMSRSYSKRLSANSRLAEERRVARGAPPRGGRRHFAYHNGKCCPEGCVPHTVRDDEAAVVREVATRWLAGEPLRALARELSLRGVRHTSGKDFNHQTLKKVLLSARLAGVRTHLGEEVAGSWEPVIDRELHARLTAANSRSGSHRAPERYLLTGLLVCGRDNCGASLNGHLHRPGARRYACLTCHRNGIAADAVDNVVWNEALSRTWNRDRGAERQAAERLATVERELRASRQSLRELDDAYWQERSVPKDTYARQATALRQRIEHFEEEARQARREREQASGFWTNLLALASEYETATPQRRRAVLEGAVQRVVLRPSVKTTPWVDLSRLIVEWRDGETTSVVQEPDKHEPADTSF